MQQKLHRKYSCQREIKIHIYIYKQIHTHTHSYTAHTLVWLLAWLCYCFAFAQMGQTPKTIMSLTVCLSIESTDACYGLAMSWTLIKWAWPISRRCGRMYCTVSWFSIMRPDKVFPRRQR